MYEIRYTKGAEKDSVKVMRSPYADIAAALLEQLKADPYSNTGGGLEKVSDVNITNRLLLFMDNLHYPPCTKL